MDIMLERILTLIPKKPDGKFVHGALKEFANTVGLKSGNLVSDWMNGRSTSYKGYLYEISAKYDVSVEWLRGETDEKSPAPLGAELSADRIQSMVSDMSTEDLAALLSMAANEMAKRNGK